MIADRDTDRVCFSDLLPGRYPEFIRELLAVLSRGEIAASRIPGTRDVWCRDYMPVQIGVGRFVQFRYAPSYLKGGYEHLITPPEVAAAILDGASCASSPIVLDGGNVVGWGGHVIVTDRIHQENPDPTPKALRAELTDWQEAKRLTVIPAEPGDVLGVSWGVSALLAG